MTSKIGDIVELQRGTTYKSKQKDLPGPVLLGLATIRRNGGFRNDNLTTYGGESPEKLLVYPGEMYVSLKDVTQSADLLGAVARVPSDIEVGRLTQDTVKLRFIRSDFSKEYVYWILRTPAYREYCKMHATGTTNLGLSRDDFLSYEVPPLTPERAVLVDLLECISRKIALNSRMNETLEAVARAIFKSWFVDFDPVKAKMEGQQPNGVDKETIALFPNKLMCSEQGVLPDGWEQGILSDVAFLNKKAWTKKKHPPQINYVDLANTKNGIISCSVEYAFDKAPSRARRILSEGDTIVGTVRPGNRSYAYIGDEAVPLTGSTGFAALTPKSTEWREYVYLVATSDESIAHLARLADGAAYPAVRPSVVADLKSVIPTETVVQAFHRQISPFFDKMFACKEESARLGAIRDTLLPKLVSGELSVSAVEKQLEKVL
ncbi:restriction endonuclease subunit S [Desulfovibrio sp. Fe33]|uniref:restriction endonuclease subunit S n=1 Tax=Desulfovibrio sp. Fe33 TaxID=3020842 RepID=UPI00234D8AA3|nr:restriction endonuclease subunit S [Desulfovibrio sp. Fe33]